MIATHRGAPAWTRTGTTNEITYLVEGTGPLTLSHATSASERIRVALAEESPGVQILGVQLIGRFTLEVAQAREVLAGVRDVTSWLRLANTGDPHLDTDINAAAGRLIATLITDFVSRPTPRSASA